MGAYICKECDNMFCSHDVNCFTCEKCNDNKLTCEGCWIEQMHEDQDDSTTFEICGACYGSTLEEARLMTEGEENED